MDPGIGHEIEVDLQAYGYPILWMQYFPIDDDLMEWIFGDDIRDGPHQVAVRHPRRLAVVLQRQHQRDPVGRQGRGAHSLDHLRAPAVVSYECGMDQPTYTPVQQIVERSGTLFFSFQDLDSTKPAGSVKIRVETIAHYLEALRGGIIEKKLAASPPNCPLLPATPVS